jgi:hypothetical protein
MKNNEPQNLFFLKGINCVKILLFSLLILFLQKSYAEGTLLATITSINTSGLIVFSGFLFGHNLYMSKHNPLKVHIINSTNQIFYYGFSKCLNTRTNLIFKIAITKEY